LRLKKSVVDDCVIPAPERARLGAELQQLYAGCKAAEILARMEACLPKDEAGNFIASSQS
jgi:hypothetical protein